MSYKVNVALKLTPTRVQQAIDRAEDGLRLLTALRNVNPPLSASEFALLLDFLPDNVVDLDQEATKAELALAE